MKKTKEDKLDKDTLAVKSMLTCKKSDELDIMLVPLAVFITNVYVCVHAAESTASKPPPKPKEKVVKKAADGPAKKPVAKKTTAAPKKKATGMLEVLL